MNIFKKSINFIKEARQELGKVSWSNRQELIGSTFVIIATTSLLALFIFIIDFLLSKGLSILFR
jgi:preprotein translocase subunit SecE